MRRLRDGEWIAGAGAVLLLGATFLDWYGVSVRATLPGGRTVTASAGGSAWVVFTVLDVVLALLALLGLALVVAQVTRRGPAVPVALAVLVTVAGVLVLIAVAYRLVDQPGSDERAEMRVGSWLGLLGVLAITAGGWRSLREERDPHAPAPAIEEQPAPAP